MEASFSNKSDSRVTWFVVVGDKPAAAATKVAWVIRDDGRGAT